MSSRLSLRLRVALAFAATTTLALVGLGAFVYYRVEATLMDQTRASLETQLDALAQVPVAIRPQATAAMTGEYFSQVLTPDAVPVASSPQVVDPLVTADQLPRTDREDVVVEQPVRLTNEDEAERALLLLRRDGDQVLVMGTSQEDVEDALGGVLTQLLIGVPLALVLASAMGYLVAGSALRPIERMRQQAATISARSSDDRLPLPAAHDELFRLGQTLNAMLDRLDAGLQRERRFVAEASHELRTPLALLRMELDLALSRPRSADELLAALDSASEEVHRLTRLSEDLLLLAASDDGRLELDKTDVDVGDLLETVATRFSTTATSQGRKVGVTGEFPLVIRADRARLDQALSNLLDNALRHGLGDVEVSASQRDGMVSISVRDQGPGVEPDFRDRAFDRFSREPGARPTGGRGLGLAIVRAIVEEHHGTLDVREDAAGRGFAVALELPGGQLQ
jgi:heavy metal sensor kinase